MEQMENLSLSWDAHQKSICSGLCQLQQRGEFVDMTLAADGHHVKVHQMVLSLVSPYIKDLIATAKCPHPVIFLNNISYTTLCSILEYIYTGEVLVPKHRLPEIIAAGKALHIRGLKEMDDEKTAESGLNTTATSSPPRTNSISERLRLLKEKKKPLIEDKNAVPAPICRIYLDEGTGDSTRNVTDHFMEIQDDSIEAGDTTLDKTTDTSKNGESRSHIGRDLTAEDTKKILLNQKVQYTISNQGGLQVIHNRYIYNLRYCAKKNQRRLWRCVDYSRSLRCPASICTDDNNQVIERTNSHNHAFHDNKIVKKVQNRHIYSIFREAEGHSAAKKNERRLPIAEEDSSDN